VGAGCGVAPSAPRPPGAAAGKAAREAELPRLHWRAALGQEAEAVLSAILKRTRSLSEAVGELAMEVAMRRMKVRDDPRFIKRYHGREKIAVDKEGRMVGVEAKGRGREAKELSKHKDHAVQLSRRANNKRAKFMKRKFPKVGKSSRRLGGPYTRDEIKLYEFIRERAGMKRLISTHMNTLSLHSAGRGADFPLI
jgi:hypothetical protein